MGIVGKRFGSITVKEIDRNCNYRRWICECQKCGSVLSLDSKQIRKGDCGCMPNPPLVPKAILRELFIDQRMSISDIAKKTGKHRNTIAKYIDTYKLRGERAQLVRSPPRRRKKLKTGPRLYKLVGRRYEYLVVEEYINETSVKCKCDCGQSINVLIEDLYGCSVTSCGCHDEPEEDRSAIFRIVWNKLLRSEVASPWSSLEDFMSWSYENGYKVGALLTNEFKWIRRKEKVFRSNNIIIEAGGVRKTLADWTDYLNLNYKKAYDRYNEGYRGVNLLTEDLCS